MSGLHIYRDLLPLGNFPFSDDHAACAVPVAMALRTLQVNYSNEHF